MLCPLKCKTDNNLNFIYLGFLYFFLHFYLHLYLYLYVLKLTSDPQFRFFNSVTMLYEIQFSPYKSDEASSHYLA